MANSFYIISDLSLVKVFKAMCGNIMECIHGMTRVNVKLVITLLKHNHDSKSMPSNNMTHRWMKFIH
jgi:hypothetical protein